LQFASGELRCERISYFYSHPTQQLASLISEYLSVAFDVEEAVFSIRFKVKVLNQRTVNLTTIPIRNPPERGPIKRTQLFIIEP
jgi:hypothetical protein